ncbi:MAG TPA: cupin domain-containing protein [Ilumatobacteraceae bacterium]|nr:cupin domain-containing protein [Ilumatobacteraceae bacterium]
MRAADSFADLLDVDVVERLLTAPARRPMLRLVRDGVPVSVSDYTSSTRLGGVLVDDVVDVPRTLQLMADGATLVLQSLQHSWPPIARFCSELQSDTDHAVQANCYLSPVGSTALARHCDGHEVFVLQIEGSKAWRVDELGDVTLEPGDVLYIPRGTWHEASAQNQFSLHLTIGVLAATYRAALRRALDRLPGGQLDRPLPLRFASDPDQLDVTRAQIAASLRHVFYEVDSRRVADDEMRRISDRRRVFPHGHLRALLHDRPIDDHTRIQADPQLSVSKVDDRIVLQAGARRLSVPFAISAAVDAVSVGTVLAVRDLPELDTASRAVFARRLVRESLVFVVDPTE